jgi:hypothetical protein
MRKENGGGQSRRRPWIYRITFGVLLVTAAGAMVVTVYLLGAAFGYYQVVVGKALTIGDLASLSVAGGTLFLGATTAMLTLATRDAVGETRDEARAARQAARASLDIRFDMALPVLWAYDIRYVRVMVTNSGPAMAEHVVVMLENIEPDNPMLQGQYKVPNGPLRNGVNVLPSGLYWKGRDYSRTTELICNINPGAREYFDVLAHGWDDNAPWIVVWIHEWREAFGLGSDWPGEQPRSPLVMNKTYTLHISASGSNADRVERKFTLKASPNEPHFAFAVG